LNTDITLAELLQALKKLQRNKAANLDGKKTEFILDARELLHMPLLIAFNCFLAETFPEALPLGWFTHFLKGTMLPNLTIIADNGWAYPSKVVRYDP
jgi:hypothetical protein